MTILDRRSSASGSAPGKCDSSGGASMRFQGMKFGRLRIPGHISSVGDPKMRNICSNWFMSLLPGKNVCGGSVGRAARGGLRG